MALLLAGGALPAPSLAQQHSSPYQADTSRLRPLGDALLEFQAATGIDLYYETSLIQGKWTRIPSRPSRGPMATLDALLKGTGLYSYRMSTGTYAIKARSSAARASGTLVGAVEDAATGRPVEDAHVLVLADLTTGTATDAQGRFVFNTLPQGTYLVQCTHVGYEAQRDTITVAAGQSSQVNLRLMPRAVAITPIIIEGVQRNGVPRLLADTWEQRGTLGARGFGTTDAVRELGGIIGVRVGDATADLHIQGGETGEHQFRLDGVPVFEPVHLRGLLGAFNPFSLERIQVHKAGFGASEGSQISGVIEAHHLLASPEGRTLDVQVDPLSFNGRLTTRIGSPDGVNARVMAAARRSLWDVYTPSQLDNLFQSWNAPDVFLLKASLLAAEESLGDLPGLELAIPDSSFADSTSTPNLSFSDYHAAARVRLAPGRFLHTSFYRGNNAMSAQRFYASPDSIYPSRDIYEWSNTNGQITYSDVLGERTFWKTRLRGNRYDLSHGYITIDNSSTAPVPGGFEIPSELTPADDENRISEFALESSFDLSHGWGLFTLGAEAARTDHRFNMADVFARPISNAAVSWRVAGFVEQQFTLRPGLTVTPGLRATYSDQRETVYLEPRLETRWEVQTRSAGTFSTRVAAGLYRQFTNQFDISSVSPSALVPGVRFWMPVDSTVAPPKAYHLAGDVLWDLTPTWALRVEGYYKEQPHILSIDYPALLGSAANDSTVTMQDAFLRSSEGTAFGAAVAVERTTTSLRGSVRYEYARAEREYAFQEQRAVVETLEPAPWSEPHRLEAALDWIPVPAFIATVRWQSAWQRPWGYRKAYYDYLSTNPNAVARYDCSDEVCGIDLTRPEDHTLAPFHQLDLAAAYTIPLRQAALQLRLDVLNVLDRDNVADWSIQTSEANLPEGGTTNVYEDRIPRQTLPRTLSFAVRLKW
jgi:hypothetical protein